MTARKIDNLVSHLPLSVVILVRSEAVGSVLPLTNLDKHCFVVCIIATVWPKHRRHVRRRQNRASLPLGVCLLGVSTFSLFQTCGKCFEVCTQGIIPDSHVSPILQLRSCTHLPLKCNLDDHKRTAPCYTDNTLRFNYPKECSGDHRCIHTSQT